MASPRNILDTGPLIAFVSAGGNLYGGALDNGPLAVDRARHVTKGDDLFVEEGNA